MKTAAFISLFGASYALGASLSRSPRRDVLSSRQAHVQRDLLDVCAGLDVDLTVDDPLDGHPLIVGHLDVCLCLSVLPDFISVNAVAQAAVALVGEAAVLADLEALINGQSGKQQCTYPPHATQVCDFAWPCGWQCGDGYVPYTPPGAAHPTQCVCPAPKSECNGKCGSFPRGCGSATPRRRRSAPSCAPGRALCGIAGALGRRAYECVDTAHDLESCGGCVAPALSADGPAATGVDCSAIPHVAAVACRTSTCVVSKCTAGFVPTAARDACAPALMVAGRGVADVDVVEGLVADVKGIAEVGEGLVADVHVGRDVADAGVVEGLVADVLDIAEVGEGLGVGVHVGRDVADVGVVEGLVADVLGVAKVGEGLVAGVHVGRDIADVGVAEGLVADVKHVVAVGEGAVVGVHLGRDIPLVGAVVPAAVGVLVPDVAAVGALADIGVAVL